MAQDLIDRKISSPSKLAVIGGSNGGLMVGNCLTRPIAASLFSTAVCQVPLLDMKRYSHLLAGASWMAEYGDPRIPGDREVLLRYSPYHNLRADTDYPRVFFATSTADDRVHPGHARKMVARMREQGHDILYFENTEGGHAGAADNPQRATLTALCYVYLRQELGLDWGP